MSSWHFMVMSVSSVRVRFKKFRVLGEIVGVTGDGTNDDPVWKKVHEWFFKQTTSYNYIVQ